MVHRAGERVATADAEDLKLLVEMRDDLEDSILKAVTGLKLDGGYTWEAIGQVLGTTRQGAYQRYGERINGLRA